MKRRCSGGAGRLLRAVAVKENLQHHGGGSAAEREEAAQVLVASVVPLIGWMLLCKSATPRESAGSG